MKYKFLLPIIFLFVLGCNSEHKEDMEIIDNARRDIINLNQKYNNLYQFVMVNYMQGNNNYGPAAVCLQDLAVELMAVNKALKIDCYKYDEKGNPIMERDNNGKSTPVEIIPNEMKIKKSMSIDL